MTNTNKYDNLAKYIQNEADSFINDYDIIEDIKNGETLDELLDNNVHEAVDTEFIYVDLLDAATILGQVENEETDWGLWEGQQPEDAIITKAFFSYRMDFEQEIRSQVADLVESELDSLTNEVKDLNTHVDIAEAELGEIDESNPEHGERITELQEDIDNLNLEIDELQSQIDCLEGYDN